MSNILIVEDEANIRRVLLKVLVEEFKSLKVDEAIDGVEAIAAISKNDYDLILSDIKMPKKDGIEVLTFAQEHAPKTPVVMISGHGDLETAVQAMRLGAYDYISKPPDLNHLLQTVRTSLQVIEQPKKVPNKKKSKKYTMVGESKAIQSIHTVIEKVAPTMARVLIQGPNGSGKELVARALHHNSARSAAPFVEVNCAAIPAELIESELFGHVKGAFTSAHKDRKGTFEQAHGGTLFLDEIGDMSLAAQAKVLRALEEHRIQRVGSDKTISVDVRVLAATNKDVKKEIKENRFREDLYHRLAVIELYVPPLNDRREDVPLLAQHFLSSLSPPKQLHKDALSLLQNVNWTGNIRQLRNVIERLHILGGDEISAEDVSTYTQTQSGS